MGNHHSQPSHHHGLVREAMRKDEKIGEVFQKFDLNKDGVLDRKEAKLFIRDICDVVCETELRLLSNWGNTRQSTIDLVPKKWKYAKRHDEQLFEIIDESGTGTLSIEEVRNFLNKTDLKSWSVYFGKIGWYKQLALEDPEQRASLVKMGLEEYL